LSPPAFLRFDPVPLRARNDGWSPELQRHFILLLARGSYPADAARQLGRSRQTAYALRRRRGGDSFAAAWDAAVDFARRASVAGRSMPWRDSGLETLLVPRFYRGRVVGFLLRADAYGLMRKLGRLDRMAARLEEGGAEIEMGFEALWDLTDPDGAGLAEADKSDGMRQPAHDLRQL
jgi:GNAT superfamily N-acetyltransferase